MKHSSHGRMLLSELLSNYSPTDMLPADAPEHATNPVLWNMVFASIERNHEAFAPSNWAKFLSSVTTRQRVPIRLDGKRVVNGHHRVWALFRAGKTTVRFQQVSYKAAA